LLEIRASIDEEQEKARIGGFVDARKMYWYSEATLQLRKLDAEVAQASGLAPSELFACTEPRVANRQQCLALNWRDSTGSVHVSMATCDDDGAAFRAIKELAGIP
jgi:hypothetical protein